MVEPTERGAEQAQARARRMWTRVLFCFFFFGAVAIGFAAARDMDLISPFVKDLGEGLAFVAILFVVLCATWTYLRARSPRFLLGVSFLLLIINQTIDITQEVPALEETLLLGDSLPADILRKSTGYLASATVLAFLFATIIALDRERTRARLSEHRYRVFSETVTDVIWAMDLQLRHTYVNPRVTELRGYSVEETMAQSLEEILTPDSLVRAQAAFTQAIQRERTGKSDGNRSDSLELEMTRKDGYTVWTEVRVAPLRNPDGQLVGLVGITRDIDARKKTEEALRASERRYRSFVEDLPVPAYRREGRSKGRLVMANPAMAQLLGCQSVEELLHTPPAFFYANPDEQAALETKLNARGRVVRELVELKKVDGEHIWVDVTATAVRDEAGAVAYYDGFMENVTEQKMALDALRLSEQRLDAVVQGGEIALLDWYPQTHRLVFSENYAGILGYSLDELPSDVEAFQQILHPNDIEHLAQAVSAHTEGLTPYFEVEFRIRAKNGEWRWLMSRGRIVERDEQGRPWRVTSTFLNVTEQKRAEEALRNSEETFRALAEHSADVIMRFGRDLRHLYVNPGVERETGIPPADFIHKTHRELGFPEHLVTLWEDALTKVFETGQPGRLEFQLPRGIWIDWSLLPEFAADGTVQAVVTSGRDITERKQWEETLLRAKEAAEDSSRTKSQFLANLSHEIRTPLNSIIGFTEIILACDHVDDIHRQARTILAESGALLALINDLLDHAKAEAGTLHLDLAPVNLRVWFRDLVAGFRPQAAAKNLLFDPSFDDAIPPWVMADSLRLRQIASNLLTNAIKFTDTGSVAVRLAMVDRQESHVSLDLTVRDTGIGIPLEKQTIIFESFRQVDGSTTRKYGGAGLGITIARQLAGLMGGALSLQSEESVGSTFRFTLALDVCPAPETSTGAASDSHDLSAPNAPKTGARILLAEDYSPNRAVVMEHLLNAGYSVKIVTNGKEAVAACRDNRFDLVLMDIQMPEMDGYEAARRIRDADSPCRDVPIVAMTAHADAASHAACRDAGMDDVITKPIRRVSFLRSIAGHILFRTTLTPAPDGPALSRADGALPSSETPMNEEVAVSEFGSIAIVRKVANEFLRSLDSQIPRMREALARNDLDLLRHEAHAIRGGAATLEAVPLAEAARRLEQLTRSNAFDNLPIVFQQLVSEVNRFEEYARNTLGKDRDA